VIADVIADRQNRNAYTLLMPALLVITFAGLLPLATVAFYSVHDTFAGNNFVFVGGRWFQQVLTSPEFYGALARSLGFSLLVLAVEIPLGIYIARRLPQQGALSSLFIVLMSIPLLTPSIVVGYLWKVLTLPKAGLLFEAAAALGFGYDMNSVVVTWLTLLLMDMWHWTSLVVLLCFAGMRAIPEDHYRAARIDSASSWAIFRYIEFPRLKLVLLIAILLRFMDSFMIYTEAYIVSRGGPGVSTTFLSHELVQTATIQFDLGEGGAMSLIYFLIVLCVSFVFFTLIVPKPVSIDGGAP
jgi:glycerol transport system permease protein